MEKPFIDMKGVGVMVFSVGICDDCPNQVGLLIQYLNSYPGNNEFFVIESTEPDNFLAAMEENKPQLVFLDIDMERMNGIRLGERIKAKYEDVVIIYITAHEKYALEAFQMRAFHYLMKPLLKTKFHKVLEEAIQFIKKNSEAKAEKTFSVQIKGEIISFQYNEICYFEKVGHKIKVHTETQDILYYDNLYNLLESVDRDFFIQCHQGYVVNINKVKRFRDKTLFLDGNQQLPVSRSFVENIKEMLAKRLFAGKERS